MKRLKILLITLAVFFSALSPIFAQEKKLTPTPSPSVVLASPTPPPNYILPFPGILPDHPLYILKIARDRIVIFLTRDPLEKIELKHHLADKRLIMGKTLVEKGKVELGATTISKGEKYLLEAISDTRKFQTIVPDADRSILERLMAASMKHEEIIGILVNNASLKERAALELSYQLAQEARKETVMMKQERGK